MPTSEFTLIYRYFSALGRGDAVDLSVGDDCAILRLGEGERLATSVDTLVAGVHFLEDTFPEDIGFRAASVAASDLAAMGARPLGMTVALTLLGYYLLRHKNDNDPKEKEPYTKTEIYGCGTLRPFGVSG